MNKCPWFDAVCQKHKQLLHNKRNKYQAALKNSSKYEDNQDINFKSAYFQQQTGYKKLIRYKRHSFRQKQENGTVGSERGSFKSFLENVDKVETKNTV